MTAQQSKQYPATNEERKKREAEALRANLARRKQQQRSRKTVDQNTDADEQGSTSDGSDKD
ncbi:hypothetical protein [Thalassospira sp. A3_1]|uniref:hypothetical protein n=1 Tax=Thalassospira sp. A3_1 TaxID=2821088 RepID=UPI001AD97E80|nr:hypothetical protein [Thalassospira sp. A3_1]MBO9505964.1 hypothetical protein [Thalassospira sp. A3_1]